MLNYFLLIFGKLFIFSSQLLNLGNGSTWPGHIALKLNPNFIKEVLRSDPRGRKLKAVIIAGTNGKTTTGKLVTEILRSNGNSVIENASGANLINGFASTIINNVSFSLPRSLLGRLKADYVVFECDENALPEIISQTNPDYVICLNLFRDQLDRYGEIDLISNKWKEAFKKLYDKTTLILNADDPQVSYVGKESKAKIKYFGLDEKSEEDIKHGADSIYCPKCSEKLNFSKVYYSHLGIWNCPNCKLKRPTPSPNFLKDYPLPGIHNKYNSIAASLIGSLEEVKNVLIEESFRKFTPAFGRGEKIIYKGKKVQIFLSKNPTSFNQSLQTIKDLGGKNLLIILNDRIPDGLDVSWIWDINFEEILNKEFNVGVSGERVFDMALRLKYGELFAHHHENAQTLLDNMISNIDENETLYILPNYSGMLDLRKILTGKKIL